MENIVINIRVYDAHPRKRVKMEIAFFDIAVKCSPLIGAHFELDADTAQLFLQRLGNSSAQIDVRGLER
jgi:hypothetical protein